MCHDKKVEEKKQGGKERGKEEKKNRKGRNIVRDGRNRLKRGL